MDILAVPAPACRNEPCHDYRVCVPRQIRDDSQGKKGCNFGVARNVAEAACYPEGQIGVAGRDLAGIGQAVRLPALSA